MARSSFLVLAASALLAPIAAAQDRFEQLPGYDAFRETMRSMNSLVVGGRVSNVYWDHEERTVRFRHGDAYFACDRETGAMSAVDESTVPSANTRERRDRARGGDGMRPPARGRQAIKAQSPDGQWIAECRDFNLVISRTDGSEEIAVTKDGHRKFKYATASWVYGEELDQNSAMWWSPDSKRIAFYEFDEREVRDFYLTSNLTGINTALEIEGYPKPGDPNPIAKLLIYDLDTEETLRVPVGDEREQYIYSLRWSPDGTYLLFNRTNRHQNHLEVVAFNYTTGDSHIVVAETQDAWQENSPGMRFLADGERFIWETERSGWKQYELRHIDGRRLTPISRGEYPCLSIIKVDEEADWVYYTAFSAENPLHAQLHRARLDGRHHARLTPENLNHTSIDIAPDHRHFVATMESIEHPPRTVLYSTESADVAVLAQPDTSMMNGRPEPEMFTFKADDGETDLYGVLHKPMSFDPNKKYPLLISVYGGPLSQSVRARYQPVNPYCEFGMLIAEIDNRGTRNRGKAFEGAVYQKLGIVDIKDQVDGVKFLAERPYVDANRVGITGHSYGGYLAALAILKYPDVFHVAVAGSAVTDWRNYDTIYTERFMRTPQENPDGYDAGSCLTYADQLKGKLLLLHGMVDDNVHPTNVWQLADKLQRARKPFQMMFFPNSGHGIGSPSVNPLKWEFIVDHLILRQDGSTGVSPVNEREDETADERR